MTVNCINSNLRWAIPGSPPLEDDDTVFFIQFSSEKILIKRNVRMHQIWKLFKGVTLRKTKLEKHRNQIM